MTFKTIRNRSEKDDNQQSRDMQKAILASINLIVFLATVLAA